MNTGLEIALVGAGAAIFGAVVSQVVTYAIARLNQKHQNDAHLRDKYEEMLHHFYKSMQYIPLVNESTSYAQLAAYSVGSPDARHALSLCLLYFEELVPTVNEFIKAQTKFFNSTLTKFNSTVPISAGGQAFISEEHKEIMLQLQKRKEDFDAFMLRISKKYTLEPFI